MHDPGRALSTALEAVAVARDLLLAECARPGGPRGEIGHCPADDEAEWAIRDRLLGAFPRFGFLGEETGKRVSVERAEQLAATGASMIGAACPFCNTMFRDALSGISKTPPKLLDIAQIAAAGLKSIDSPAARTD